MAKKTNKPKTVVYAVDRGSSWIYWDTDFKTQDKYKVRITNFGDEENLAPGIEGTAENIKKYMQVKKITGREWGK